MDDLKQYLKNLGAILDEKIPRDVVSLRDGGGGRKLSYLEGHYVIDRLNKVFGHMGWLKEITDVRQVTNTTSKGEFPAYLVKVKLTVRVTSASSIDAYDGAYVVKEAYGYGSDKSSQNAHELAIKEAVTDALKIAAKDLGMSMGLALYDKTQENVEDAPPSVPEPKPAPRVATPLADAKGTLIEAIKSYVAVAEAQKKLTKVQFKLDLSASYGAEKLAELSEDQLNQTLAKLKQLTK